MCPCWWTMPGIPGFVPWKPWQLKRSAAVGRDARWLTTPERAKHLNKMPVMVKGIGAYADKNTEAMTNFYASEIAQIPAMDLAAKQAYAQAGLKPDDIITSVNGTPCFAAAFTCDVGLSRLNAITS